MEYLVTISAVFSSTFFSKPLNHIHAKSCLQFAKPCFHHKVFLTLLPTWGARAACQWRSMLFEKTKEGSQSWQTKRWYGTKLHRSVNLWFSVNKACQSLKILHMINLCPSRDNGLTLVVMAARTLLTGSKCLLDKGLSSKAHFDHLKIRPVTCMSWKWIYKDVLYHRVQLIITFQAVFYIPGSTGSKITPALSTAYWLFLD